MKTIITKFHKFGEMMRGLGNSPRLDWYFILLCFVLLVCTAVLIDLFFYNRVSIRDGEGTNIPSMIETLDKEDISQVIQKLNDRELDSENLSQTVLFDPSL
ncbi:MAG: hypothetical protein Q7R72_01665 [bacterium]|nr:hypothetical protein [bacterium]